MVKMRTLAAENAVSHEPLVHEGGAAAKEAFNRKVRRGARRTRSGIRDSLQKI